MDRIRHLEEQNEESNKIIRALREYQQKNEQIDLAKKQR